MSEDWKTIRVPKDAYDEAKTQKEDHNRTWGEQVVAREEPSMTVEVDAEEVYDRLKEDLDDLLNVDVTVEVEDSDLPDGDVSEADVKRIIHDEIESKIHQQARTGL